MKLLQISDCHLTGEAGHCHKGWDTFGMLQELLEYVLKHESSIDILLFTGDISQDETPESYVKLLSLVEPLNIPSYALPGNHDDFTVMRSVFKDSIRCDKRAHLHDWQILFLDSTVTSQVSGYLSAEELEWLKNTLKEDPVPTLIALHHPPCLIGSAWMDEIGLENYQEFLAILESHPQIKTVIFGHIHQAFESSYANVALLGVPSSCYQFKPGSRTFEIDVQNQGYRILELGENGHIKSYIKRISG